MILNQKEIVLLSYPFSNLEERKVRPALVISNNELNKKTEDCILVPITGVIKKEKYSIIISQNDLVKGNLIKMSRIKVDKPFCAERKLILKKIGILKEDSFDKVKKEFVNLI